MEYRFYFTGLPGAYVPFSIIVDDKTGRWHSDPAGCDLPEPQMGVICGYPHRPDKMFNLYPGGKAESFKSP
jgi:hypothetical protein